MIALRAATRFDRAGALSGIIAGVFVDD